MTWADWISFLVSEKSQIVKAGIYGHNGSKWASSNNLKATPAEIRWINNIFIDPAYAQENGFHIAGVKMVYISEDKEEGIIQASDGNSPITIYKSPRSIIIGIGRPDAVRGNVTTAVTKIGEKLEAFGY